jgi:hypothetical protein
MTGPRAVASLCLLCALVLSSLGVQGATAATKGTTAFTCRAESGGTGFSKEHCTPADAVVTGASYKHVAVPENISTKLRVSSERTAASTTSASPWILKETFTGVPLEIVATAVIGEGTLENTKDGVTGEHYMAGEAAVTLSGVSIKKPEGKGCKLFTDSPEGAKGGEGVIDSKPLKATTKEQGDFVKFEAKEGTTLATFFIECNKGEVPEALEGTWTLTGSLKCPTNGATVNCIHTEVTTANTLKGKGFKAGIEGSLTISAEENGQCGLIYTPLSATTTETP